MSRRSFVYNYFELDASGNSPDYFICNICKAPVKRCGGTSSFVKHLKMVHNIQGGTCCTSTSDDDLKRNAIPVAKQTVLSGFGYDRQCSKTRSQSIDEKMLNICLMDLRPLNFVDGFAFKQLMNFVEPSYHVPSRTKIARLLNQKFNTYMESTREIVKENAEGSLTTDLWSSAACDSYMGVTYHAITKNWKLISKTLAVQHFPTERHTAENIKSGLKAIIDKWQVQCVDVVHDNAGNMVNASSALADEIEAHFGDNSTCFAHTLQLCIKPALNDAFISNLITRQRNIAKTFKNSNPLWNALRKEMQKSSKAPLRPKVDMEVRWGSTVAMLQRNLVLKKYYAKILVEEKLKKLIKSSSSKAPFPTDQDWPSVKNLVEALLPLNAATELLGGQSYISASLVYPVLFGIYNNLVITESDFPAAQKFKRRMQQEIEKRFKLNNSEQIVGKKTMLATALDPRFKDLAFLRNEMRDIVYSNIEMVASKISSEENLIVFDPNEAPVLKKKRSAYQTLFGDAYQASQEDVFSTAADEVDAYIKAAKLPTEGSDVLKFWQENESKFPRLSRLARKYLSIPATSVPSERIFSIAGYVLSNRRLSLNPETAEKIILLHENLKEAKLMNSSLKCDFSSSSDESEEAAEMLQEDEPVSAAIDSDSDD